MADATEIWNNALVAFLNTLQENNVTADLDFLYVHNAPTLEEALINRISPGTYDATTVGTPEFVPFLGIRGSLSPLSYLDTNFNPTTASNPKFTQDNASLSVYVAEEGASGQSRAGYYDTSASAGTSIAVMVPPNNTCQYRLNTTTASQSGVVQTTAVAMWTIRRHDAAQIHMDKDGVRFSTFNAPSVAVRNGNLRICGQSNTSADDHAIGMSAGGRLTESQSLILSDAWQSFLQALEALSTMQAEGTSYGIIGSEATLKTTRLPSKIKIDLVSSERVPNTVGGGNPITIPLGIPSEKRRIVAVIQTRGAPTSCTIDGIPCTIENTVFYQNIYSEYTASVISAVVPNGEIGVLSVTGIEDNQMWTLGIWAISGNDSTVSSRYGSSYSSVQDIVVPYFPENNGIGIAHVGNFHPSGTLNVEWEGFNKDFDDLHNGSENSYSGASLYNPLPYSGTTIPVRPVPQGTVSQNLHFFLVQIKGPDLKYMRADPGSFGFGEPLEEQNFVTGNFNESLITFSRPSAATYFNISGEMRSATNDMMRLDYDPATLTGRGLMIEPMKENIVRRSGNLLSSPWGWSAGGGSIAQADPAPMLPDKFWRITSNGETSFRVQNLTVPSNSTRTVSMYVKRGNIPYAGFEMEFVGGLANQFANILLNFDDEIITTDGNITHIGGFENIGDGRYRLWLQASPNANQITLSIKVHKGSTIVAGDFTQYWGVQCEAGLGPPTSYIPTFATSVIREADTVTFDGLGLNNWEVDLGNNTTYTIQDHVGDLTLVYAMIGNPHIRSYSYGQDLVIIGVQRKIMGNNGSFVIFDDDGARLSRALKVYPLGTSYSMSTQPANMIRFRGIGARPTQFVITGTEIALKPIGYRDQYPYKFSSDTDQGLPYTGITEYGYSVHGTYEQDTPEDQ